MNITTLIVIFIVCLAFFIYIGITLVRDITHPVLYAMFWLIYGITIFTIGNTILNYFFYNTIGKKKGPLGDRGKPGEDGDEGPEGECEPDCKMQSIIDVIMKKLNVDYNTILEKERGKKENPPRTINNAYFKNTLKRIVTSKQFKQVAQLKNNKKIEDYVSEIFTRWLEILAKADESEGKKHFQDYLEIYGEQVEWESMIKPKYNPFHEIEKYDVFYWGLNKEFRPIKIEACFPKKDKPETPPPPIKGLIANMYSRVYDEYKIPKTKQRFKNFLAGKYYRNHMSIWRTQPITIDGDKYLPLGDVAYPKMNVSGGERSVTKMGGDNPVIYKTRGNGGEGPIYNNVLLAVDNKYVKQPPETAWTWKWNDIGTGSRRDVTFWNAEDFKEDGIQYRCMGSIAMSNYGPNPTKQFGRANVPLVCVDERALEEIPNRHRRIWTDKRSGADNGDGSLFQNLDGVYNLTYFGDDGHSAILNRKMYKIKQEFLNNTHINSDIPKTTNDEKDLGYGKGYQSQRYSKNRKNGLFDLLDLVVKSDLENQYTQSKVYLEHSGLNNPNSYFVRQYNIKQEPDKCIKYNDDLTLVETDNFGIPVQFTNQCNSTQQLQLWEIDFIGQSKELCFIKSKETDKYLYSLQQDKFFTKGSLPSKKLDDAALQPFIWRLVNPQ
jgi:hypothetical protein